MKQFLRAAGNQGLKSSEKGAGIKNTDVTKQEAKEGSAVALTSMLRGPLKGRHDLSKDNFHKSEMINTKTEITGKLLTELLHQAMCVCDIG